MADSSLHSALKLRIEPGTFLFREGDDTKDLYIVQYGKVRIFKTEAGVEIDLDEIGPGGVVGEVAAIDDGVRSASGVAMETTEVLVVPVDNFKLILEKIPDWFKKIATILVQRLREVDKKIHRTMLGDLSPQIAAVLNLMTYTPLATPSPEGPEISQKVLENELVDLLQVQLGDVAQALGQLGKQGLIAVGRGKVVVKNRSKLESLADTIFAQPESTPAT